MNEYRVAESDDGIPMHRICITDDITKRSVSFAIQVSQIKPNHEHTRPQRINPFDMLDSQNTQKDENT